MLDALARPVHFGLVRTVDAADEPVTLEQAKAWLHVTDTYEDQSIGDMIQAARQKLEDDTGLALLNQTWTYALDCIPATRQILLPVGPVSSVSSIKVYATDDTESTIATSVYRLDTASLPARIVLKDGQSWTTDVRPQNGYLVTFVAGYGSDGASVPASLLQAMRLLMQHWHWNRSTVIVGTSAAEVPLAYTALVDPYRLRVIW